MVEDALDINSSMWLSIDSEVDLPSLVPYCLKRQLIDLIHINNRCNEELDIIKEEMGQIVKFYEGKLKGLEMWSKEMRAHRTDSHKCRGLLSIALTKLDELRAFSRYLREIFSASEKGILQTSMKQEYGILPDVKNLCDNTDNQIEFNDNGKDVANRVQKIKQHQDITWCHVPTDQNPADLGSRDGNVSNAVQWINGPPWLSFPNQWPTKVDIGPSPESSAEAIEQNEVLAMALLKKDEFTELMEK